MPSTWKQLPRVRALLRRSLAVGETSHDATGKGERQRPGNPSRDLEDLQEATSGSKSVETRATTTGALRITQEWSELAWRSKCSVSILYRLREGFILKLKEIVCQLAQRWENALVNKGVISLLKALKDSIDQVVKRENVLREMVGEDYLQQQRTWQLQSLTPPKKLLT